MKKSEWSKVKNESKAKQAPLSGGEVIPIGNGKEREHNRNGKECNGVCGEVVKRILTAPDEDFVKLSVTRLAKEFSISRTQLSRVFKVKMGETLDDYLFREKMTRAVLLLTRRPELTVKAVAARLGYCTSDYFIRVFRDYYSVVPGKYREYRMLREGEFERRNGLPDRRNKANQNIIPISKDERKAISDRRTGERDRRQNGFLFGDNVGQDSIIPVLNVASPSIKPCEACHYKLFAANHSDFEEKREA